MKFSTVAFLTTALLVSETLASITPDGSQQALGAPGPFMIARSRKHHHRKHACHGKHKHKPKWCHAHPQGSQQQTGAPSGSQQASPKAKPHDSGSTTTVAKVPQVKENEKKASHSALSTTTGGGSSADSGPGLPSKWGLSWTGGFPIDPFKNKAGFMYNWATEDPTDGTTGIPYIPMLWGVDDQRVSDFKKNVLGHPENYPSKLVMAFNEPDISGQANMDAQTACRYTEELLVPLKEQHGFKLIGPAVAWVDGPWYTDFRNACPDTFAKFDFHALHYYDADADKVIKSVNKFHQTFGKPLFITETACWVYTSQEHQCSGEGQAQAYLTALGDFARKTDFVKGFAPFGLFTMGQLPGNVGNFNRLATQGGTPTNLFWAALSATV